MKKHSALALFSIGWICTAMFPSRCAPGLVVPPTHIVDGESPHALPAHKVSMGGGLSAFDWPGNYGVDLSGFILNMEGTLGLWHDLDLRLLLTDVELKVVGHSCAFPCIQEGAQDTNYLARSGLGSNVRSGTLRLKWNPFGNRFWAMTAGGGMGISQNQGFYSLEHAQILGFENRRFVPYLNYKWSVNLPKNPKPIYWRDRDYHKTPLTTWGNEFLMGVKIPFAQIPFSQIPLLHLKADPPLMMVELGMGTLQDRDTSYSAMLGSVMFVFPFEL